MGSGSSAEVDAHLRKWEAAVTDLQTLCNTHRRTLDGDRIPSHHHAVAGNNNNNNNNNSGHSPSQSGGNPIQQHGTSPPSEQADAQARSGDDPGGESERSFRRRASSLVSFNRVPGAAAAASGSTPPAGVLSPRDNAAMFDSLQGAEESNHPPTTPKAKHHNRQQVVEAKKARHAHFESYVTPGVDMDQLPEAMGCSHFAAVAIALSSLLGGSKDCQDRRKRVTVEDIFFAAQVPLHMLHTSAPDLTVMSDIVREFMDVDNRFKGSCTLTTLHLDITPTVGQVEIGANEVGDRQPKLQLPEFRRIVSHDLEESAGQDVMIVNYDPYLLEQEIMVDQTAEEEEGQSISPPAASKTANGSAPPPQCMDGASAFGTLIPTVMGPKHKPNNDGAYAVIVDYRNAVQPMVTIAEGAMTDTLHAKLMEVPLSALFKAMMSAEEAHRARGYIRISKKKDTATNNADDVSYFFTPELCSGKVLGTTVDGCGAQAIGSWVSPHITACAWAMHLLCGVRPNTHGHGKGLPVTEFIRTLRLPSDVYLNSDLPLDQVYLYFQQYLHRKLLDRNFTISLNPVLTKISRDDAVPTISVFDLESILIDVKNANEDPDCPEHIMILQYNANVAHNVVNIATAPQWCVLVGYDDDAQVARLIDASARRFSHSWTCSLDRLHKAITSYGYLIVSRPKEDSSAQQREESNSSTPKAAMLQSGFGVGALRHVASTVQQRLDSVREQAQRLRIQQSSGHTNPMLRPLSVFKFPSKPYTVTILALAMAKLDVPTTIDDFLHKLPYDMNSLMLSNFSLECASICIHGIGKLFGVDDQLTIHARHIEKHSTGKLTVPIKQLADILHAHFVAGQPNNNNNREPVLTTAASTLSTAASMVAVNMDALVPSPTSRSALIVKFDNEQLTVFGSKRPFGRTGIIVDFCENDSLVTVCDANPNEYFRTWTVSLESLHRAMVNTVSGHRINGLLIVTRDAAPEAVARVKAANAIASKCRTHHLSLLPVQNLFHVSPSPQVQGLSLALAQVGHFYSPEEIFYEAYLKTVSDQRRRGSQAFAWRDVEVSLAIVNKKIDARMMSLVARKFFESRRVSNELSAEVVDDVDLDTLPQLLQAASHPNADHVLMLNYNTQVIHGLSNMGSSVALVETFDPATQKVGMVDAEYSLFGLRWSCSLEQLIEAGDLDNDGSTAYGFVRITAHKNQAQQQTHLNNNNNGHFFTGGEQHPADAAGEGKRGSRTHGTTFVEQ